MKKKRKNNKKDEPQLSKEEHQLIFDIALDQGKVTKPKQKKAMNPILKYYLSKHKVLIEYVHDINGYRKGVVVSTSRDQVGWSLVKDFSLQRIDPMRLPVLEKLIREKRPIADIIEHRAYLKCIKDHASVCVPLFDKDTGLFMALGRSLSSTLEEKNGNVFLHPAPPHDKELKAAISRMVARSRKYFK
jgi:hypothetical protein